MSVKYLHAFGGRRRTFLFTTLSLLALDLASSPAWAADGAKAAAPADPVVATAVTGAAAATVTATDAAEPIEVLVTARRREEKAQDVPIAITALGGNFLKKTDDVRLAQDVVSPPPPPTAATVRAGSSAASAPTIPTPTASARSASIATKSISPTSMPRRFRCSTRSASRC